MAFVIDGSDWTFDGMATDVVIKAVNNLLERVFVALQRDESVYIGQDFQLRRMNSNGEDLWTLFSRNGTYYDAEVSQELTAWLMTAKLYTDEPDQPDCVDHTIITVDQEPSATLPDVAWAHHNVRNKKPVAMLGLWRFGNYQTQSNCGAATLHWIGSEAEHKNFWRAAIEIVGDNEQTLEHYASHAFPELHFHPKVWRGLKRLGGGYRACGVAIRRYLAILDDSGDWAFSDAGNSLSHNHSSVINRSGTPSSQTIERRFTQLGLIMAPEKPNVYANKVCREAREVQFGTKLVYCEWHGKIEPHRNRIHVCPPIPETNNKVAIAIFADHLPLPGG